MVSDFVHCGSLLALVLTFCFLPDGYNDRISNFRGIITNDADIDALLKLRSNILHYVRVVDSYAPCIVGSSTWNSDSNMEQFCGDNNDNFQTYVLSVSDEAFMLLVLINYGPTWCSEIAIEHYKVSTTNDENDTVLKYTTHSTDTVHWKIRESQTPILGQTIMPKPAPTLVVSFCAFGVVVKTIITCFSHRIRIRNTPFLGKQNMPLQLSKEMSNMASGGPTKALTSTMNCTTWWLPIVHCVALCSTMNC